MTVTGATNDTFDGLPRDAKVEPEIEETIVEEGTNCPSGEPGPVGPEGIPDEVQEEVQEEAQDEPTQAEPAQLMPTPNFLAVSVEGLSRIIGEKTVKIDNMRRYIAMLQQEIIGLRQHLDHYKKQEAGAKSAELAE